MKGKIGLLLIAILGILLIMSVVFYPQEVLGNKLQGGVTATSPPTQSSISEISTATVVVTSTKVLPTSFPPTITVTSEVTVVPNPTETLFPPTPLPSGTPMVEVTVVPVPTLGIPTTTGVIRRKETPYSCAERAFLYELVKETGGVENLWSGSGVNFGEFEGELVEVTGWGLCLISTDPAVPACCFIDVVSIESLALPTPEPLEPCPVEVVAGSNKSLVGNFQNFRDSTLRETVKGKNWIEIYNKHRKELNILLFTHPKFSRSVLEQLTWFSSAWVTQKDDVITKEHLETIDLILSGIILEMSPELLTDVEVIREKMWSYEGWRLHDAVQTELEGNLER